ncbi:alpha/beta hydrolase-fold protein [Ignavibacterium sp.]|uniref:esterase family protein n=1 Tax=Ignavibacterium sp. TaxID=2651167 RepID=UPI00307DDF1C
MKENYHKWHSLKLDREFEMLTFGSSGLPVIIFPTSGGRYYEAKDRGLIKAVSGLINSGALMIFCPDSINSESWYNYSVHPAERVKRHIQYENAILDEVIEFAEHETGFKKVAVSGCSFGGYHAANIAFKHPDKIGYLFTLSGAYDIKRFIFGHYDDDCYFNNPPDYIPNLNDDWYLSRIKQMHIVLGTGEHDFCLEENYRLSEILSSKKIKHQLDVRKNNGHDWQWWLIMFREYLLKIID